MIDRYESGFTLIEIIAALVILGILAAAMGKGMSAGATLFFTARETVTTSQKAQVAMMRLTRELRELTHIAAIGDSPWIIYDKMDGRHAVAAAAGTIKLYSLPPDQVTLNPMDLTAGGHILLDQVEGFILSFHAGNLPGQTIGTNTWSPQDSLSNLAAIGMRLDLAQPWDNTHHLSFDIMIHPRNINSSGGAVPSTGPDPPTSANYCFISSLSNPVSGRGNPERSVALSEMILAVVILAFFSILKQRRLSSRRKKNERGSALLYVVITLTLFSVLAAALLPMTGTFQIGQVAGAFSDQAGLLAESGYRYAASKYLNAKTDTEKNNVLEELHQRTYRLADNAGQFLLNVYPYFFYITEENSSNRLTVSLPGGTAENLSDHIESLVWVGIESKIYPCQLSFAPSNATGILTIYGTVPAFAKGTTVLMAAKSADFDQTISKETPDLYFENHGGDAFPDGNAQIIINGRIYLYRRNNRADGCLTGISDPGDPTGQMTFTIPAGSEILLYKYIDLETTGSVGSGSMQTERKLTYHTPLPVIPSIEERREWHDPFNTMDHWEIQWGRHQIDTLDNDPALRVTDVSNQKDYGKAGLIALNWSATPINLQNITAGSNGYLNYTAQVKIGFDTATFQPDWGYDPGAPVPKYYSAGLMFRLDNNQNGYGLSLMRGNSDQPLPFDAIDNNLVPENNSHLLVLWQATDNGSKRQWLAYKRLDEFFDDMENGGANWSGDYPWRIIDNIYNVYTLPPPYPGNRLINSPFHSLHNVELGDYDNHTNIAAQTRPISIVCPCNVVLKFAHFYEIAAGDHAFVELSKDGGKTWEAKPIYTILAGKSRRWEAVTLDLGAFPAPTDIRIRFRLQSDHAWTADGWFVDDVALVTLPIPMSTLAVQVSEAATLHFNNGGPVEIESGSIVSSTGGRGRVVEPPLLSSADWEGGNAAGILRVEMDSGEFASGETLAWGTVANAATVQSFRERENLIRAYYGSNTPCGTGDADRFNLNRLANERITSMSEQKELAWPPAPDEDVTAQSDHFIQIQWDKINPAIVSEAGTALLADSAAGREPDSVIRSWEDALLITSETPLDATVRPEIGLHSFGHGALNIFFDDFGLTTIHRINSNGAVSPLME